MANIPSQPGIVVKFNLRRRLFLSHLLVGLLVSGSLVLSGEEFVKFNLIHQVDQKYDASGQFLQHYSLAELIADFDAAWRFGVFWSLAIGGIAAGGVGYWMTRQIVQPLRQMEKITHRFAKGHLGERMPESQVLEFSQLSSSFNHMAASLEGVEQRRRELVSDLTHELRTPLTVLRGYLEELADGRIEPAPEIYVQLARETSRLQRLVHDLQELSKAEAGYLAVDLQPVQLTPLLTSLVQRFSDQVLEEGPQLKLDLPPKLPLVLADLDRVEQILVNLLGNALRYTPQGSITVRAWTTDAYLWIAVIDTGVGIAATDLPHVFERFWRADQARSRQSGGTGIGLAITLRLVELQGG
ncbi:sensor histidine kinase [Neosynechococcus sphagnicola]|uniref:sensor histidine kinase n=1 Tax=Neosynechococcus sphagnicola TaxID=1501145 RepID=UPI000A8FCA89|nr:ATP-binding protein [Neosynechococcus sphagnicola]